MKKKNIILTITAIIAMLSLSILPFFGVSNISWNSLLEGEHKLHSVVFWEMRVPRVLFAFFVGAALSLAGLVFQAVFRNDLASPFTLGVSSAASLGASIYFKFGLGLSIFGISGATIAAFFGSIIGIFIILGISHLGPRLSGAGVLLAGVALSFFCSSLVVFLQYISDMSGLFSVTRWMMGSVEVVGYTPVIIIAVTLSLSLIVIFRLSRELDLLSVGEEFALTRGVDVRFVELALFLVTALLVAVSVSLCGVIGFIGIMVPHICRLIVGPNHRILVIMVSLVGGVFLSSCDAIARTIMAPSEIPVGILTSLLGGPFFLVLLLTSKRNLR